MAAAGLGTSSVGIPNAFGDCADNDHGVSSKTATDVAHRKSVYILVSLFTSRLL